MRMPRRAYRFGALGLTTTVALFGGALEAQTVRDPKLSVRTVASGLVTPSTMAFMGANEILVLEKSTGRVQHLLNGVFVGTALDLAVNFGSERGLLGIVLHPSFSTNHFVYLYWTES